MKALILPLLIALGLATAAEAQTETFDIAKFVPPKGWKRTESNGMLIFEDSRTVNGRVSASQIYLFPSRASSATAGENFQAEWTNRIVKPLGVPDRPKPQTNSTPDGWTSVTASADISRQGVPIRIVLVTMTGSGKVMSVEVSFTGTAQQAEIQSFFSNLKLKADPVSQNRPAAPAASSVTGSLAGYSYTVPDKWTRQESRDGIFLVFPVYSNGERCQLSMLPMRPSTRALPDEALSMFRDMYRTDPLSFSPAPWPKLERGISLQGWEYFIIKKSVGGNDGDYSRLVGTTFMVAKLGDQLAIVVAQSKAPLVSNCFGELVSDAWPQFFDNLQFTTAKSPDSDKAQAAIRQRLEGTWMTATASVGLHYTFLSNGRYSSTGATMDRTRISSTEVLETTRAYFGDGAYTFDGNTIVLAGDDHRRSTKLFRLEQESKDGGKTWMDNLCLLDPGATGEVCYQRQPY